MVQSTLTHKNITTFFGSVEESKGSVRTAQDTPWLAMALFFCVIAYSIALSYQASLEAPVQIGTQVVVQSVVAYILMFWVWRCMPQKISSSLVYALFSVGIAARLVLLFTDPYTSNDVSRYLFDGRILLEGLDPYRVAHDAPELVNLRAQWQPPPEHAKYVTLYPPLALGLYSVASAFGPEHALVAWKFMTTTASLAIAGIAYKVLVNAGYLRHLPLVLFSPLLILEAGESVHIDVFSTLAVIAAIWAWQCQRFLLAGVVIGLGVSIKLLPLFLLVALGVFSKTWRAKIELAIGTVLSVLTIYGVAFLSGLRPLGSISVFFEKWRASSPLFHWFEPYLGQAGMSYLVIGVGATVMTGVLIWGLCLKHKKQQTLFAMTQAVMAVPLLLSPVVFPWYLMPLALLFALRPNLILALWLMALPVSYEVLNQYLCCNIWSPAGWAINLIGVSLIAGAIYSLVSGYTNNTRSLPSYERGFGNVRD